MTDKEKQAIEMFYNNPNEDELTRLWHNKQKRFIDFFAVVVAKNGLLLRGICESSGHVTNHCLEDVDFDPPKTLYDELKSCTDNELYHKLIDEHRVFLESNVIEEK